MLVLVISSKTEPYLSLDKVVKDTWGGDKNESTEIFYCYGGEKINSIVGNEIHTMYEETLSNIGLKTLKSFELIKDREFSYVFRTNTSSYIHQENLLKFIADKPTQNFYCGIVGKYHLNPTVEFCSGAGYFLSRDVFENVLNHANDWDHTHLDDVSLGMLVKKLNVPITTTAKRLTLSDINFNYDKAVVKDHYHIRCAAYQGKRVGSDSEKFHMNNIHNIFKNDLS